MTRRTGNVEQKSTVRVSEAMRSLRDAQTQLNWFLWSTELCYGFALTSEDSRLADPEKFAADALSNVQSAAWFPNTAGRIKYFGKVSSFLDQLRKNTATVAEATAVKWYSHFEDYLDARLKPGIKGPFTNSLDLPQLTTPQCPVRLQTVLRADFSRHVRNLMVHEGTLPSSSSDPTVVEWSRLRERELTGGTGWKCASPQSEVRAAVAYVVDEAINHVRQTSNPSLTLPFFYALFTLGNLDSLAFEIEEALQPTPPVGPATIQRQSGKIRRNDMVVT